MRVALALATALVLAGCSGSPSDGASSAASTAVTTASTSATTASSPTASATAPATSTSSAAPAKALTESDLSDVLAAAPPVNGKGATAGTQASVERVRSGHARLAAAAQAARITPDGCAGPLREVLAEDADAEALAVGTYAGIPVELRSFRDATGPRRALSAIARASGACQSFTGSVLGRSVTGRVEGSPIEDSGADAAYGALFRLDTGSGPEEEARVLAGVGSVLVLLHAPKGTAPDAVKQALQGLVATTRAAQQG